jgi:hypothetical protein
LTRMRPIRVLRNRNTRSCDRIGKVGGHPDETGVTSPPSVALMTLLGRASQ